MATRITRPEFEAFVHPLIQDLLAATEKYNLPENAKKWFSDVSDGYIQIAHLYSIANQGIMYSHSTPISSAVK